MILDPHKQSLHVGIDHLELRQVDPQDLRLLIPSSSRERLLLCLRENVPGGSPNP